jgi:hypothetical protein
MTARRAFAGYDFSSSWGLVAAGGLSSVIDPINAIGVAESREDEIQQMFCIRICIDLMP